MRGGPYLQEVVLGLVDEAYQDSGAFFLASLLLVDVEEMFSPSEYALDDVEREDSQVCQQFRGLVDVILMVNPQI